MAKFIKLTREYLNLGEVTKRRTIYVDPEKIVKIEDFLNGTKISAAGLGWHIPQHFVTFTLIAIGALLVPSLLAAWAEAWHARTADLSLLTWLCALTSAFCFCRNYIAGFNRLYVAETVEEVRQKIEDASKAE